MEASLEWLMNLLEGTSGRSLLSTALNIHQGVCLYLAQLRNEIWIVTERVVMPYCAEVVVYHCQFAESVPVLQRRVK
jgi:hypothetical protein